MGNAYSLALKDITYRIIKIIPLALIVRKIVYSAVNNKIVLFVRMDFSLNLDFVNSAIILA
jgi:hypothetical protein